MEETSSIITLITDFFSNLSVIDESVLILSVTIALGLLMSLLSFQLRKLRMAKHDLTNLHQAVRCVCGKKPIPSKLNFYTEIGNHIFRSLIAFRTRDYSVDQQRTLQTEVFRVSEKMAACSDEYGNAVEEAVSSVMKLGSPEVVAAATFVVDRKNKEVTVSHLCGLPQDRVTEALLLLADRVFDEDDKEFSWGYLQPRPYYYSDFSSFNVGMMYMLPLENEGQIYGALWLGLADSVSMLTETQQKLIAAAGRHIAAAVSSAGRARSRLAQSDADKDAILGMSHDLRAPGNSAMYSIKCLVSGELGPVNEQQELYLQTVESCLEEQQGIVSDLMNYAQYQKGILEARREHTPMNEIIESVIKREWLKAKNKGLKLSAAALPSMNVLADRRHINRIISNFISNAIKYTEEGIITVSAVEKEKHWELLVRDTGIGVPIEERKTLFEPFTRCENGAKQSGVGLGLSVSHLLAEINGGYVSYEPRLSGGSVFTVGIVKSNKVVNFPIKEVCNVESMLILDDSEATLRTYKRYVSDICPQIFFATEVKTAKYLLDSFHPALIITDLHLKEGTSLDFISSLKEQIPVIVVSGSADMTTMREVTKRSNIVLLEKPIDRTVFRKTIQGVVKENRKLTIDLSSRVMGDTTNA